MTLRDRTRSVLEFHDPSHTGGRVFGAVLVSFILLNVAAVVASSFEDLYLAWRPWFDGFEAVSVTFFTAEYLARLWVAHRRWAYARSFLSLVDLLAILPFYLPLLIPMDLRFLRVLRVVRLVRVLKLGRFIESFDLVRRVLHREKDALIASLFLLVTLLVIAACLMFAAERDAQPAQFPNIVAAMWWAIVTLTTVGYGDVYPVTALGKLLSGVISILGIGMVALPAGIISSGFITEFNRSRSSQGPVFVNLKKGTRYRVLHRAQDCTNARDGTPVVVYASLDEPHLVFVRDEAEFHTKFTPETP